MTEQLPGIGGIFNSGNLSVYGYVSQRPLLYVDPNGEDQFLYFWKPESTGSGAGHVAIGVGTQQSQTMFEANPVKSAPIAPMAQPFRQSGSMEQVISGAHNSNRPDLILQLKTTADQDSAAIKGLEQFFSKNANWQFTNANCASVAKTGLKSSAYDSGISPVIDSPVELAQDLFENNTDAVNQGDISVLEGDWQDYRQGTGAVNGVIQNTGRGVKDSVKDKVSDWLN